MKNTLKKYSEYVFEYFFPEIFLNGIGLIFFKSINSNTCTSDYKTDWLLPNCITFELKIMNPDIWYYGYLNYYS